MRYLISCVVCVTLAIGLCGDNRPPRQANAELPGSEPACRGKSLSGWIKDLKAEATATRIEAASAIGSLGPRAETAIPALVEALYIRELDGLGGRHEQLFSAIFEALAEIGEPAVPALVTLVRGNNPHNARCAAEALGSMGPAAKEAIPALIEALTEKTPQTPIGPRPVETETVKRYRERMESLVDFPGIKQKTTLQDALRDLQVRYKTTFWINEKELNRTWIETLRKARRSGSDTLGLDFQIPKVEIVSDAGRPIPAMYQVTLGTVLNKILSRLPQDATWVIRADSVEITSVAAVRREERAWGAIAGYRGTGALPIDSAWLAREELADAAAAALGQMGKPAVSALTRQLHSQKAQHRLRAASALQEMGTDGITALTAALKDDSKNVRLSVLFVLKRSNEVSATVNTRLRALVPAIVERLDDEHSEVRQAASAALPCHIGPGDKAAIPAVMNMLHSDEPTIVLAGIECLRQLEPQARAAAIPALIDMLNSDNQTIVLAGIETLRKIGPEARGTVIPALITTLNSDDPAIVLAGIDSLRRIGPEAKAALPKLRSLQQTYTWNTSWNVAGAAGAAVRQISLDSEIMPASEP